MGRGQQEGGDGEAGKEEGQKKYSRGGGNSHMKCLGGHMECLSGTRLRSFFTLFTHATPGTPANIFINLSIGISLTVFVCIFLKVFVCMFLKVFVCIFLKVFVCYYLVIACIFLKVIVCYYLESNRLHFFESISFAITWKVIACIFLKVFVCY